MTYKTRFCPRMFRDVPAVGRWTEGGKPHWCIDCWAMLTWRKVQRWWREGGTDGER
jgi:hypothetical protein